MNEMYITWQSFKIWDIPGGSNKSRAPHLVTQLYSSIYVYFQMYKDLANTNIKQYYDYYYYSLWIIHCDNNARCHVYGRLCRTISIRQSTNTHNTEMGIYPEKEMILLAACDSPAIRFPPRKTKVPQTAEARWLWASISNMNECERSSWALMPSGNLRLWLRCGIFNYVSCNRCCNTSPLQKPFINERT